MSLVLKRFNMSDGSKQPAVLDLIDDVAVTAVVFSEVELDGCVPGQANFKHSVEKGTEPGTWTD